MSTILEAFYIKGHVISYLQSYSPSLKRIEEDRPAFHYPKIGQSLGSRLFVSATRRAANVNSPLVLANQTKSQAPRRVLNVPLPSWYLDTIFDFSEALGHRSTVVVYPKVVYLELKQLSIKGSLSWQFRTILAHKLREYLTSSGAQESPAPLTASELPLSYSIEELRKL
ncbi:hypothetical protein RF11_15862 [Thelohanellus kitauei]|uniref:Uncharacterized protein n=1 Tax=Thelohanellus kitauei TaxID=669202 RepID=A0A0C2N8P3_THEKT|nr:hypothetical protein RF11_15862 [Thelohanellus kitauei]